MSSDWQTEVENHGAATSFTVGVADAAVGPLDQSNLDPNLRLALRQIARTGQLLVSCDYDGTLAPIVDDPNEARPLPEAVDVLRHLAMLPATSVAVVSGRALRDLAAMSRLPREITLVGSHGAEFDLGAVAGLNEQSAQTLSNIIGDCVRISSPVPGTQLEIKPAAIAVHVRRTQPEAGEQVIAALRERFEDDDSVFLTAGKNVLEISVVQAHKGNAVEQLREDLSASAVIFLGDDATDEDVFANFSDVDLAVKVGEGNSIAAYRVEGPQQVIELLAILADERQAWIAGANAVPIEDHALLSDGTDLALLTPDGSISWMCHPGPDAPAIFAGLLGDPEAGHLTIRPRRGGRPLSQNYLEHTMTVQTRWSGVVVTDYLDSTSRSTPGNEHQLRLVRAISGREPVTISFAPRPYFGSVPVGIEATQEGLRITGSSDSLVLIAPDLDWHITYIGPHPTATATIDPAGGDYVVELHAGSDDLSPAADLESERRHVCGTEWVDFVSSLRSPPRFEAAVQRSALTLKALCHKPTGAVLAAATTSLPEWIGGIRNWDYRYCWLRDGAMTVGALALLGRTQEADAFIGWLNPLFEAAASPERVHPLYTLDGNLLGPEAVVDTLPGYAGSRPVRIGNAAQGQVQLDVFGPICNMIADTAHARGFVTGNDLAIINSCVEAVERRWNEPDHGIWEIRDAPRDHVHSRVMCWMAVDQALKVLALAKASRPDWEALADRIKEDVLTNGWNEEVNSFVSAYGRTDVDAAVLAVVTSGMVAGDDPRAVGTIHAVEASLRDGPTVYRYRHEDGLPGTEGGMHICTTWLIEAYAASGMLDEARNLFRQLLECAGETGLLSEMFNPSTERGLGNHPQAYSHLGLIRCALVLETAENAV